METIINIFKNQKINIPPNFNPSLRDEFVKEIASTLPIGTKVLDVSSGAKPYMNLFNHCLYTSHEFNENSNIIDKFRNENSSKNKNHDIYSEIDNIPLDDNTYDFILCTEVFEHIPEPIKAMKEFVRICKPQGKILITAPFTSGVHQEPYHFYSGFSPFFYNYLKEIYNLNIIKFKSQGDIFLLNHQEIQRCLNFRHPIIRSDRTLTNTYNNVIEFLKLYTLNMSNLVKHELDKYDNYENMLKFYNGMNNFTIGYCVLFEKKYI